MSSIQLSILATDERAFTVRVMVSAASIGEKTADESAMDPVGGVRARTNGALTAVAGLNDVP